MKLLDDYRQAARASGRHLLGVLLEALKLRLSGTRLGLTEYLDFQLCQTRLGPREKAAFAGIRAQARGQPLRRRRPSPQYASGTGFIDDRFLELMKRRGLDRLLWAAPRPGVRSAATGRLGARRPHWRW